MENEILKKLQDILGETELLSLKKNLETHYATLDLTSRVDFLDEIELVYLPNIKYIRDYPIRNMAFTTGVSNEKKELIEKWVNEKQQQNLSTTINVRKLENDIKPAESIQTIKSNKSLLLNGKQLNLSERFKIANKVLNIDKTIRLLNISDLEKYQLLAYIIGCDKDNARNLMNGAYNSKDIDLSTYFDELGLNK